MATLTPAISNEYNLAAIPERVVVIASPAGPSRSRWISEQLKQFELVGVRAFKVSCDFSVGGPWAGVADLFSALLSEILRERPTLIQDHSFELVYILPSLRRSVTIHNPNLTDLASSAERTRNYPADRAVRNIHGLIDLLHQWKTFASPDTPWVIACDSFDEAGAMSALFFRELIRRRSALLNIRLLAGTSPENGSTIRAAFETATPVSLLTVSQDFAPADSAQTRSALRTVVELEQRIGDDEVELQTNLPLLVSLWNDAGDPDKILYYRSLALETYNTLGLYADALRYGDGLLALASRQAPLDYHQQWSIFIKILMCHLGLDHVDASQQLMEEVGLPLAQRNAIWRNQLFYLMAMLHARFKKPRDFAEGEAYLERSLAEITACDLPAGERHFRYVFNRNGLAMIRNFQRRHEEAIDLCRDGFAYLNEHLPADEHRLHRSILLYNIAQVYAAGGAYPQAFEYFSATIAMDPNYSEYYNERANVLLQMDRLEDAKGDYLRAIELSPPYFEVLTNLGQCYRRMGAMTEAIEQYSRALDLEPRHLLARLGRAKAYEETGESEAAIEDYGIILELDPTLWEAAASRGVLHYEAGRLRESLADFDAALGLKPEVADLHENRAVVLAAMDALEPTPWAN